MKTVRQVLNKILETVCVVLFICMVLLTTYQVVVRYFFRSPSSISETLTRYAFVWLILLSATYIFGTREHIAITFVKDKLTGSAAKFVSILNECITIFFAVIIMVYGGAIISHINLLQYDSILRIPTGTIYAVIPISGVMIIFYSVCNILEDLNGKETQSQPGAKGGDS